MRRVASLTYFGGSGVVYHRRMEQGRDMRAVLKRAKEEASRIPEDRKGQHNQRFDAAQRAAQVQATFLR